MLDVRPRHLRAVPTAPARRPATALDAARGWLDVAALAIERAQECYAAHQGERLTAVEGAMAALAAEIRAMAGQTAVLMMVRDRLDAERVQRGLVADDGSDR